MRTTINVDDDVAAAIDRLRKEGGLGISEALNQLARRGMVQAGDGDPAYVLPAYDLAARIDITDVAEVLDLLDGDDA